MIVVYRKCVSINLCPLASGSKQNVSVSPQCSYNLPPKPSTDVSAFTFSAYIISSKFLQEVKLFRPLRRCCAAEIWLRECAGNALARSPKLHLMLFILIFKLGLRVGSLIKKSGDSGHMQLHSSLACTWIESSC